MPLGRLLNQPYLRGTFETNLMIITDLNGGLGNQLFQYAAGRYLSSLHQTQLKVNISTLRANKLRGFELDNFNISAEIASENELRYFMPLGSWAIKGQRFRNILLSKQAHERKIYQEPSFRYDTNFNKAPANVMLIGYWQSEKYFEDITELLKKELTVKEALTGNNLLVAQQITSSNSVSLHVRRGDYVTDKKINSIHGVCDLAYYHKCVEKIAERIVNPTFFIFSDDPAWVAQNLVIGFPCVYVTGNLAGASYEDLRLMSMCKHQIIANSSFSWWGAWMNNNPEKIVLSPLKWFNNTKIDTIDLIPSGWIRV